MGAAIEVVKVGGSLLTRDDFVPAMRRWLEQASRSQPAVHRVLIVGGGALVDALRTLDATTPIDPDAAHWQAVRLMQVAGMVVGNWLPEWPLVDRYDDLLVRIAQPGVSLFLAEGFLRSEEPDLPGDLLPVGWQATSDSIAARLAICLKAGSLVLLKSREASTDEQSDWNRAADGGLVDECFPRLAKQLPVVRIQTLPGHDG